MESRKTIFIVSGSFRTGTSMMMKMLGEAGIGLYYHLSIDTNPKFNPDGFFEINPIEVGDYSPVWMDILHERAIKVFRWKLNELPDDYDYKIIFMQRNTVDSMRSTAKMLGQHYDMQTENENKQLYEKLLQESKNFIASKKNMQVRYVQYEDVIAGPEIICKSIAEFLSIPMDISKMALVPDQKKKHFAQPACV